MTLCENVEWLQHSYIAVHGVPHDANKSSKRRHQKGYLVCYDASFSHEHESRYGHGDGHNESNERDAKTLSKHKRPGVSAMFVDLLSAIADVFTLPQ